MSRSLLLCASILAAAGLACSSKALTPAGGAGAGGSLGVGVAGSGGTASAGIGAAGSGGAGAAGTGAVDAGSAGAPGGGGYAGGLPACATSGDAGAAALLHRPPAIACQFSTIYGAPTKRCASDADCAFDGGSERCLDHMCTADACLVDDDCPNGGVCNCAVRFPQINNSCLPSACRTDADCGAGGICGFTGNSFCTGGPLYSCLSAADTCCSAADCADAGTGTSCALVPETGRRQCVRAILCGG